MDSARLFIIEGNISCGKTTVVENLRLLGYSVFEEPLEVWQKEYVHDGHNILDLFYSDMKRWGFKFEMVSLMTRYKQLKAALQVLSGGSAVAQSAAIDNVNFAAGHSVYTPTNIVFIERSLLTDRHIFALNLYHEGVFDALEWKIYCDWHDLFMEMVRQLTSGSSVKTEYIYIQTPPEECFARKVGRARVEENNIVPKYFQELHDKHEEWLASGYLTDEGTNHCVHIIRGCGTREEVLTQVVEILGAGQLIKKFVSMVDSQ
jgi:deoxyadenosine/deoxycytidine kinase